MPKQNKIFRLTHHNARNGFTLSEILLTLAIMGSLMALTIPTLIKSTNKNAYVNGLKKTYGMLDTATNQIMTNNSGTLINAFTSSTDAQTKYGNILEYNKICAAGAVTGNCWASSTNKLSGGAAVEGFDADTNHTGAVLADGTTILFDIQNVACDGTGVSLNLPYSTSTQTYLCGYIVVDVNGFNNPNTFGRDMFIFLLGSNGLYSGGDPHTLVSDLTVNCNTTDMTHNGLGCAAKVLNEQAMNY